MTDTPAPETPAPDLPEEPVVDIDHEEEDTDDVAVPLTDEELAVLDEPDNAAPVASEEV